MSRRNREWKLRFNKDETAVIFNQINEHGVVVMEFGLQPPDHAELYYALKDWFGD